MIQQFRVTVDTNDEQYVYYPNVDMELHPDPEDAEEAALEEGVAAAIWDGMNQADWFSTNVEFL